MPPTCHAREHARFVVAQHSQHAGAVLLVRRHALHDAGNHLRGPGPHEPECLPVGVRGGYRHTAGNTRVRKHGAMSAVDSG